METDRQDSLEERMEKLRKELCQAEGNPEGGVRAASENDRKGYSQALKISSEFIAAVIVGAMLGYLLDMVLPIKPWGLIIFLLLGFCAGILNVLRVVGVVTAPHPVDRIGEARNTDKRPKP
ncbi:ATP synthase protein I [Rhizobium sp. SG_E_25_P2]|uniref:AtpZ/AtpI family protein n=1 Tax=Rhizobium sp. SG_E_25_P2 TaxID=2879942 RepID=UPI002475C4F4|nr:AtpZ/AtpI family protein [Rhizobium sp. SG_E_25_P2]MDH6266517.1 ATP synthase protein I [Rhizobium sp. SG_E_25_P2]